MKLTAEQLFLNTLLRNAIHEYFLNDKINNKKLSDDLIQVSFYFELANKITVMYDDFLENSDWVSSYIEDNPNLTKVELRNVKMNDGKVFLEDDDMGKSRNNEYLTINYFKTIKQLRHLLKYKKANLSDSNLETIISNIRYFLKTQNINKPTKKQLDFINSQKKLEKTIKKVLSTNMSITSIRNNYQTITTSKNIKAAAITNRLISMFHGAMLTAVNRNIGNIYKYNIDGKFKELGRKELFQLISKDPKKVFSEAEVTRFITSKMKKYLDSFQTVESRKDSYINDKDLSKSYIKRLNKEMNEEITSIKNLGYVFSQSTKQNPSKKTSIEITK